MVFRDQAATATFLFGSDQAVEAQIGSIVIAFGDKTFHSYHTEASGVQSQDDTTHA